MSSCCGLDVVLRVPVRVIDNDNIGARKVDTDSSCLGGKKEYISIFGRVIVAINSCLSLFGLDLAINSFIFVLTILEEFFNKVKHMGKLREYQDFLPLFLTFL